MATNERNYLMKMPSVTPEQYMRNCYIDLANWTSSVDALSNLQMSETMQMPTVAIKHQFWVEADYTAEIGREESETTVVEETHKFEDGSSYNEEVTKETKYVVWDAHKGRITNVKRECVIPLGDIDMSALYEAEQKKTKPFWKAHGWDASDLDMSGKGWELASEEVVEKLEKIPFNAESYEENEIAESLDSTIRHRELPAGYRYWQNLHYKPEVVHSTTTIGLQIDYQVKCSYKGQTFHLPHIGKETTPLPTQGNIKKEFKSKASTFNFAVRKEWLRHNHPNFHKNRKLKEKMLLLMIGAGVLGVVFTIGMGNVLFLLGGGAVAAGAWFKYKSINAAMAKIDAEATEQANREYQKLKEEEATEIAEHNASFENLKEKKIEALNALFVGKGMQPLSEEEKERLK